ncbi:hypothetical protein HDU97_005133 [Phlyctochytrium planicorne]|nr:hypothetical protein HDU97_005133 [Phlyctochytrium planicorne]
MSVCQKQEDDCRDVRISYLESFSPDQQTGIFLLAEEVAPKLRRLRISHISASLPAITRIIRKSSQLNSLWLQDITFETEAQAIDLASAVTGLPVLEDFMVRLPLSTRKRDLFYSAFFEALNRTSHYQTLLNVSLPLNGSTKNGGLAFIGKQKRLESISFQFLGSSPLTEELDSSMGIKDSLNTLIWCSTPSMHPSHIQQSYLPSIRTISPNLTRILLAPSMHVQMDDLAEMLSRPKDCVPHLTDVQILLRYPVSAATESRLVGLLKCRQNLTVFKIKCVSNGDSAERNLGSVFADIPGHPSLQALSFCLVFTSPSDVMAAFDFVSKCKKLEEFRIAAIDEDGAWPVMNYEESKCLAKAATLPLLKILYLGVHLSSIADEIVTTLAANNIRGGLRKLWLNCDSLFWHLPVLDFMASNPYLRNISLKIDDSKLTEGRFEKILDAILVDRSKCPRLRVLHLLNANRSMLSQLCRHLKVIASTGCSKVDFLIEVSVMDLFDEKDQAFIEEIEELRKIHHFKWELRCAGLGFSESYFANCNGLQARKYRRCFGQLRYDGMTWDMKLGRVRLASSSHAASMAQRHSTVSPNDSQMIMSVEKSSHPLPTGSGEFVHPKKAWIHQFNTGVKPTASWKRSSSPVGHQERVVRQKLDDEAEVARIMIGLKKSYLPQGDEPWAMAASAESDFIPIRNNADNIMTTRVKEDQKAARPASNICKPKKSRQGKEYEKLKREEKLEMKSKFSSPAVAVKKERRLQSEAKMKKVKLMEQYQATVREKRAERDSNAQI